MGDEEPQQPHKPVHLNESQKVLTLVMNLEATYGSPLSEVKFQEAEVGVRIDRIKAKGVEASWYEKGELTGEGGVTSWVRVLTEADNISAPSYRRKAAGAFKSSADLSVPISDLNNAKLLDSMSTPEQRNARQDRDRARKQIEEESKRADEARQRADRAAVRETEKQARLVEEQRLETLAQEAEQQRINEEIKKAISAGFADGQRLASRIYDRNQRAEVQEVLDSVVTANRKGLNKRQVGVVRGQILSQIDGGTHDGKNGGLTGSYLGKNYLDTRKRELSKVLGREPDSDEMEKERQYLLQTELDIGAIRRQEVGGDIDVPLGVAVLDFDVFTTPNAKPDRTDEAVELRNSKVVAYKSGFKVAYQQIREGNDFNDMTRPWFVPVSLDNK